MKNYKIYVINLKRSPDRWNSISSKLKELGVDFERMEAADAQTLSDEEISKYYSKELNRKRMSRYMTKGEIACYISHIYCWQKMLEENLDFAITIEDDVVPNEKLLKTIEFLSNFDGDFGYLQLARKACDNAKKSRRYTIKKSYGDFKVAEFIRFTGETPMDALSKESAKLLLKTSIPFGRPIDSDADFYWHTKIRRNALLPFTYEYDENPFESLIEGRSKGDSQRIRTGNIFTKSFIQDSIFFFRNVYNKIKNIFTQK